MIHIVSKNGEGFSTVQQAVNAAQPGDEILIKKGLYQGRVVINKDQLYIHGENAEEVILTASYCAKDLDEEGKEKGTFRSFTLIVTGNDVALADLTVRNDAGDGRDVGQAVAVYAAGDRGSFYRVRMIAHQDTLFCGPTMPRVGREVAPLVIPEGVESVGDCPPVVNRQYFKDCYIEGDVDYIFGPYRCWFENCTLYLGQRGGYYTAANTPEACRYGFVFDHCHLTGEGSGYLGRPWRAFARTVFLHCRMEETVHPWGFTDWDENRVVTDRLGEYDTTGPRADQSVRHPSQKRMTEADAAEYTRDKVLDGWVPEVK